MTYFEVLSIEPTRSSFTTSQTSVAVHNSTLPWEM